jgi:hypothetical protein
MRRLFGLGRNPRTFEFKCPDCQDVHRGSPSFAYAKPTYYFDVLEPERDKRIKLSDDLCTILPAEDDEGGEPIYCIRATLDVPIHGAPDPFCWGVWVTQSEENFNKYIETFSNDQSGSGSFGWLAVTMPHYNLSPPGEPFESLACDVEWGAVGKRPKIIIYESAHQLFLDQSNGIDWETAILLARAMMHPSD